MKFFVVACLVGCASSSPTVAGDDLTGSDVDAKAQRLADYEAREQECLSRSDRSACLEAAFVELVGRRVLEPKAWIDSICYLRFEIEPGESLAPAEQTARMDECLADGLREAARLAKVHGGFVPRNSASFPTPLAVAKRCVAPSELNSAVTNEAYSACVKGEMQRTYEPLLRTKMGAGAGDRVAVAASYLSLAGGNAGDAILCLQVTQEGGSRTECIDDWLAIVEGGVAALVR